MRLVEEDLFAIMTLEEAKHYHAACEEVTGRTLCSGEMVFKNMIVDTDREGLADALIGEFFWCLVLVHPVWADQDVVKSAWNRIRSRFVGDTITDGIPTPKLILALT